MHYRYLRLALAFVGVCLMLASAPIAARAAGAGAGWGNVKGRVVWAGAAFKPAEIKVDKDQGHCLSRGALLDQKYVVNPKNNGVRWVMVWLADPSGPAKKLPIHPSLRKVEGTKVSLDQPCCMFEPHVFGIREGQVLDAKNSATIAHNVNVLGGIDNPNLNQIIPPGGSLQIEGWKASKWPVQISCNIHGWMKTWARVFNHPYFAVTDENGNFEIKNAPAGKFNMIMWQEENGWVKGGNKIPPISVEIKPNETTDVGKVDLKPTS